MGCATTCAVRRASITFLAGSFGAARLCAAGSESIAARAERDYIEAQQRVRKEPTNVTALVQLSAAAFNWAELARKNSQRAEIANDGIDAAREAIHLVSTNAAAHYWLAINFGQLARTKSLGALHLVREMERELLRAIELDDRVDYAGPDRSIGYLYRDAPGWPTSVGNKKKAREHLERAVKLHPEFPDNQLSLLETFDQWGERQDFQRQLKLTEKCLADARKKFTGAAWEQSWADWDKRWSELKAKAAGTSRVREPAPVQSSK
jgi:tetratricopeptide (TPR) repeat protein